MISIAGRPRFGKDIVRSEYVAHLDWTHIRVVAGARPADVLNRVQRAWAAHQTPEVGERRCRARD